MYKRVLVPLDGSRIAEKALEHLRMIVEASSNVEKVFLVRVVKPMIVDVRDYIGAERIREMEEKLEKEARDYLEKVVSSLKDSGITAEVLVETNLDPATTILDIVNKNNVDLIIMSTHGESNMLHWIFGSVAHRILMRSPVSILLAVPDGRQVMGS